MTGPSIRKELSKPGTEDLSRCYGQLKQKKKIQKIS